MLIRKDGNNRLTSNTLLLLKIAFKKVILKTKKPAISWLQQKSD